MACEKLKTAVCPRSSPQETFCKRSFVAKSEERPLFLEAQSLIIQTVNTSNHNFAIYHKVNSKKKVSIVLNKARDTHINSVSSFPFTSSVPLECPPIPTMELINLTLLHPAHYNVRDQESKLPSDFFPDFTN